MTILEKNVAPLWCKSDIKIDKPTTYCKPMGEILFKEELTLEKLSQMGNPLERLSSLVEFYMFRPFLEDVLLTKFPFFKWVKRRALLVI